MFLKLKIVKIFKKNKIHKLLEITSPIHASTSNKSHNYQIQSATP